MYMVYDQVICSVVWGGVGEGGGGVSAGGIIYHQLKH